MNNKLKIWLVTIIIIVGGYFVNQFFLNKPKYNISKTKVTTKYIKKEIKAEAFQKKTIKTKNILIAKEKVKFDVKKLKLLVTESYAFDLNVMGEMLESEKFDDVVYYLLDKASYDLTLQEINSKNERLLYKIASVENGEVIVEQVACNLFYCFSSFILANNQSWKDSKIDGNDLISSLSFSADDSSNLSRQLFVYAIDKRINSVVRSR